MQPTFETLSSFDQINLGSTFLQAVVTLSFAGMQVGVARHFDRPAMRAMSKLWQLFAIATIPNILSSWSGAIWQDKELSRALNTVGIALLAAAIPYVRLATDALSSPIPPARDTRRDALAWALAALVLHGAVAFGAGALFPHARIVPVTLSRLIKLAVIAVPAQIALTAYVRADQHKRAIRLLAFGFSALAVRQALSVVLGLRVGMPDLPFSAVVGAVTIEVLAIMCFGVMTLLANTAEELALVQQQSDALLQAEARIASGERMESLGRLAAGVAHDFNNVLQVVQLASGSLRSTVAGHRDTTELDAINDASRHGTALVAQLLTFARQQQSPDPKRFDVFDRLRSLAPMLERVSGPVSTCEVVVSDGGAVVMMDPAQFEQIVINLVTNARDAVNGDGHVGVHMDVIVLDRERSRPASVEPGRYARLTVEDNGHGIPDEIRARIFEPFFTTKTGGKGSGLGLAMVHGIVRRAGGGVVVESTPNVGTRFRVYLPVAEVIAPTTARGRAMTPPAELTSVA